MEWIDNLREDLNDREDIQLLGAIEARYLAKKKEIPTYICIVLKDENLRLVNVKPYTHSIKVAWELEKFQAIVVDGSPKKSLESHNHLKETNDNQFSLQLGNKTHIWEANEHRAKLYFIQCFITNCRAYLSVPVSLNNVNLQNIDSEGGSSVADVVSVETTYEELSKQEIADLELVMGNNYSQAFKNIDSYAANLKSELNTLESANVAILLQSETTSEHLNSLFDDLLLRIDQVDAYIKLYNESLAGIRYDVQKLEKRDNLIAVQKKNYRNLELELGNLLDVLDPEGMEKNYKILEEGQSNLEIESDRLECLATCKKLSAAVNLSLESGLGELKAVETTLKIVRQKEIAFVERFRNKIISMIDDMVRAGPGYDKKFVLPSHRHFFQQLEPFQEYITHWLKPSHWIVFNSIIEYYEKSMFEIYDLETKKIVKEMVETYSHTKQDLDAVEEFSESFYKVALEHERIFFQERSFCERFFGLEEADNSRKSQNQFTLQRLREMMNKIYKNIPTHFDTIMDLGKHIHPVYCIHVERQVDKILSSNTEDKKMIFSETLARMRISLKRYFDSLVQAKISAMNNIKPSSIKSSKKKENVFQVSSEFGPFTLGVKYALEKAIQSTSGSSFVEKQIMAYCEAVFECVERFAQESKTKEVCLFENYHYLFSTLSAIKLPFLNAYKETAHSKYKEHMQLYIETQLESPLEKVAKFMAGVQKELDSGVLDSEVSFQIEYSRHNLKKAVESYPGKEVKKGLAAVYRKIERDLSSDSHLLQVVWRHLSDEFSSQYTHYQNIIDRCYHNCGIDFDFSMDNLQLMFVDVTSK